MMLEASSFTTIGVISNAARVVRDWQPDFAR
jgi:hypothetical protein